MIFLVIFGAVDEPFASGMIVQIQVCVDKWQLVCNLISWRYFYMDSLLLFIFFYFTRVFSTQMNFALKINSGTKYLYYHMPLT